MSEYFKDFFANFRERISNPLVFSYFLAWIVWNWKITLALIWHDPSQQVIGGVQYSISEYADRLVAKCGSCSIPFIIAIFYTFGLPYLKGWIQSFNLKVRKYFEEAHFEIDNTRTVSLAKYLKLREKLNEDLDLVHRNILDEEERIQELQSVKQKNQELRDDLSRKQTELVVANGKLSSTYSPGELDGYWTFELNGGRMKEIQKIDIYILESRVYRIHQDKSRAQISKINRYFMHPEKWFLYLEFEVGSVGYPDNIISEIPKVLFIKSGNNGWYHADHLSNTQINFLRMIEN